LIQPIDFVEEDDRVQPEARTPPPSVVFDLDGTLLDRDSTEHWLRGLYSSSGLRLLAGLLLAPFAGPLLLIPSQRRRGASLLLWLATWGMDEAALLASISSFVERMRAGRSRLGWRKGGLETLARHLTAGHRVVVVTGAPTILAGALLTSRGFVAPPEVLGTSLKPVAGGWGVERHCHGQEKCSILAEAGYGQSWAFAYSDSHVDLPILERAAQPFLVNAKRSSTLLLQARGLSSLRALRW
jgi:phosphatidylglycerophosphatase C